MTCPWFTFRTCGATWSSQVGRIEMECDGRRGGALTLACGPLRLDVAARVELDCAYAGGSPDFGATTTLRQESDSSPDILPVEEGPERLVLRTLYKLLDAAGHYHGDGLQEVWLYPEGQVFFAFGLRLVDSASHPVLRGARIEFRATGQPLSPGGGGCEQPFGAGLPDKRLLLAAPDGSAVALHWAADIGVAPFKFDFQTPPFYHRWPHLFHQWGTHPWEKRGWAVDATSGVAWTPEGTGGTAAMRWLHGAKATPSKEQAFYGLMGLSLGAPEAETVRRVQAHQQPLAPQVAGGEFRYYDAVDAVYEVMKGGAGEMSVTFPPDPLERTARVRVFKLCGRGAVLAEADGRPLTPQLLSFGRCTDDPLVPVRAQPHGPADEVVATLRLNANGPSRLLLRETEGMHAAYQMRDAWRGVIPWRSGNREGDFEFSLRDGRARRLRKPGATAEAVAEHPLFWLLHCGYSPSHYVNHLREFEVTQNGPEAVAFRYAAVNLGERVRSEVLVRLPWDPRALRMETRHAFTTLGQWEHGTFEFFDAFPFLSNDPARWHYDRVLFVPRGAPERRIDIRGTLDNGVSFMDFEETAFFAMLGGACGNLFLLVRRPAPCGTRMRAHLCGCWIDLHLDVYCSPTPLPPGVSCSVETDLAIFGDERTTDAEALALAERSLAAGALIL